jgi:hypothetical protein
MSMAKNEDAPVDEKPKRSPIAYMVLVWEPDEGTASTSDGTWREVGTWDALSRKAAARQYVAEQHVGTPPEGHRFAVVAAGAWEEFAPTLVHQPKLVW